MKKLLFLALLLLVSYSYSQNTFPTKGNVSITHNSNERVELSIYNSLGMLIETKDINNSITELDISHLKRGNYLFVLKTNEQTLTKKLIKM